MYGIALMLSSLPFHAFSADALYQMTDFCFQ
jgi:hypothetical protein